MMKNTLCYLVLGMSLNYTYAVVPTSDVYQEFQDLKTMGVYTTKITTGLLKIGEAVDIAVQLRELKSLQDVSNAGGAICRLCSVSEQQQLQMYIKQVNDDLCSQFSVAMSSMIGVQQTIRGLQDIIKNFNTNPKEAGLALQSASIQTQAAIQGTLAQIQLLLAQSAQKRLAEEKLAKQNNTDLYAGVRQSGL
ncbi:MAG: hypothetical protein K0R49_255 [Burkholderiales bacterium]|jgi:hypothetical protein|nr:hypothetical protein [Burkholderiales bacterium]MCE3268003.1 hypothetical protein [Burkholderiales bacterium]